ncbi:MAG: hypothetical protein J1E16_01885 [Muribaculaceae bacterium]|nr:hypothetical protein [Muribaculaceae bacterium]
MNEGKRELVDLGLPSGTLWATCNLGAKEPWEKGDYYAWGEIKAKTRYNASNSITYGLWPEDLGFKSFGNLPNYDAATHHDSELSTPTFADFQELAENCECILIELENGKLGMKANGKNGNSIFLPFGGEINDDYVVYDNQYGYYWVGTPYAGSVDKYGDCFWIGEHGMNFYYLKKYEGASIRPIKRRKEK